MTTEAYLPEEELVNIRESNGLIIYTPNFSHIDLVCDTMPSADNPSVILCCEAAFTGELLVEFKHINIAGNHTSSGIFHKGYKCEANSGAFAYFADTNTWTFDNNSESKLPQEAEVRGGMSFGQSMIIFNGKDVHNGKPQKDSTKHKYRALCELEGKLCIIDGAESMPYGDFIKLLMGLEVTHALYLDMGRGWNYSFYRDKQGEAQFIHHVKIPYTTNWITFYK